MWDGVGGEKGRPDGEGTRIGGKGNEKKNVPQELEGGGGLKKT